eukprot:6212735-Pleurochrysis_carterae.AAC.8
MNRALSWLPLNPPSRTLKGRLYLTLRSARSSCKKAARFLALWMPPAEHCAFTPLTLNQAPCICQAPTIQTINNSPAPHPLSLPLCPALES